MLAQYPNVRLAVYLVSLAAYGLGMVLVADDFASGLIALGGMLGGVATGTAISHMPANGLAASNGTRSKPTT